MTSAQPELLWNEARTIKVCGADAMNFLQGYVTCDVQRIDAIPAGQGLPMALCNLKGRVVANGWVVPEWDAPTPDEAAPDEPQISAALLIVHASLVEQVRAYLKPYITFSKCKLGAEDGFLALASPDQEATSLTLMDDLVVTSVEHLSQDWQDASDQITQTLVAAQFAFVSKPVSARFLPQMLGLDKVGAVDFDKGCYLGQEIVARAQFRGAVKRQLMQFDWQDTPPVIGESAGPVDVVVCVALGSALGVGS